MKSGDERGKPPRPMDPIDINGVEPSIVGCTCEELVALEYHNAGELVEPACVTFLKFGGAWHRLYFDHGIIFWRASETGRTGLVADDLDATFRPVDLAARFQLRGLALERITYAALPDYGSEVRLEFEQARCLVLRCVGDTTTYA